MDINFNINTDLVLPESVQSKLNYVFNKVGRLSMRALELQTTEIGNVRFTFRHSALGDVLTDDERFQQTCFVTRYETLPVLNVIDIEHHNGKFYFKNFKFMRQLLNEYRTIILNEKDSIYYKKIHHFCFKSMSNSDPKQGLSIQVRNEDNEDTTSSFLKFMGDQNKSIKKINGIPR